MHLGRPRSRERFFQQALHSQTHGHRRSSPSQVSAHVPSRARDGGGVTGSGNTSSQTHICLKRAAATGTKSPQTSRHSRPAGLYFFLFIPNSLRSFSPPKAAPIALSGAARPAHGPAWKSCCISIYSTPKIPFSYQKTHEDTGEKTPFPCRAFPNAGGS